MPLKQREYYLATSRSRDFTWLSLWTPIPPRPSRNKVEPTPTYRVPKIRRKKMPTMTEEHGQALMAPPDVKARADIVRSKSEAVKPKRSRSKRAGSKNAGPWSDWYVSDDRGYYGRARKSPNETWDYQFTQGYQEPPETQTTSPTTSGSELSPPFPPSPGLPAVSPSRVRDSSSPKSSWPTIITTSTGQPTENITASSSRTLTTLPKEVDDSNQAAGSALVPVVTTAKPSHSRGHNHNNVSRNKRPVGPVMRLLQEGRSRKSKAKSEATKSKLTTAHVQGLGGKNDGGINNNYNEDRSGDGVILTKTRTAYSRKLHAKVKSEKELKVDPKRRVKVWLKGLEVDTAPVALDAQGLPVYR
ncbi:hypothetical protein VTK56DRAFT_9460 [Thermocarpiscus australiensis]